MTGARVSAPDARPVNAKATAIIAAVFVIAFFLFAAEQRVHQRRPAETFMPGCD
jgi:hypothetical protein